MWSDRFRRDWTYTVLQPVATMDEGDDTRFAADARGSARRTHLL